MRDKLVSCEMPVGPGPEPAVGYSRAPRASTSLSGFCFMAATRPYSARMLRQRQARSPAYQRPISWRL